MNTITYLDCIRVTKLQKSRFFDIVTFLSRHFNI